MGRYTTTPNPESLDRYSVGEITQLTAVPDYYNAGTSQWLKTATYASGSSLSSTAKTNLTNAATANGLTVNLLTTYETSLSSAGYPYNPLPAQRISGSGVTVYPGCSASTTPTVFYATSAGVGAVSTSVTAASASNAGGGNVVIASNNTTIFAYSNTTAPNFMKASSTTDGSTWSTVTLTGLPSADTSSARAWGSGSAVIRNNLGILLGSSIPKFGVFWCGARFIAIIGDDNSTFIKTSTSTNGIAWSGDTTTTVLNNTTLDKANQFDFYRNGNNCFISVANVNRYSTDGGITWANSTGGTTFVGTYEYYRVENRTDPTKFAYIQNSGINAYYTSDNGATWTYRSLPYAGNTGSTMSYKGSTLFYMYYNTANSPYRSTNDGATWSIYNWPLGTLSIQGYMAVDANRFYFYPTSSGQILTSSDGSTWTTTTLSFDSGISSSVNRTGIISFDSNTVLLTGYSNTTGESIGLLTNDGGVTWAPLTPGSTNSLAGNGGLAYSSPDGPGGGSATYGGSNSGGTYGGTTGNVLYKSSAVAGGAFFRTGTTVITPTNANAVIYVRVS